jgi:hypothetical protein
MSKEAFDDNCPGCKPAFIDIKSGRPLPDTDPIMQKVLARWESDTTFQERETFHKVMCLNSREPFDLAIVKALVEKLSQ